jgi:hypothetical protein
MVTATRASIEGGRSLTPSLFLRAPAPRHRVDPAGAVFTWSSVVASASAVVFLLWIVLVIGGARVTDAVDDLGELGAALVAAGACAVAAWRRETTRGGWGWLGASCLAWAVGEGVWSYYDLVRGVQVPFPSLADVGFLIAVPLAVIGLLRFPNYPRRAVDHAVGVLDGVIIAGSLLFASWSTVLGPLYNAHAGGVFKQTISLAYPASDVILVSLCILLFSQARYRGRGSLLLVMAGIVSFAVADSAFAYMTEVNSYGSGTFLDAGWVVGYLLIALGAIRALHVPVTPAVESGHSTMSMLAPYVPVLAVLAVTAFELMRGTRLDVASWVMAFALALFVLARHLLVLTSRRAEDASRAVRADIVRGAPRGDRGGGAEAVRGLGR